MFDIILFFKHIQIFNLFIRRAEMGLGNISHLHAGSLTKHSWWLGLGQTETRNGELIQVFPWGGRGPATATPSAHQREAGVGGGARTQTHALIGSVGVQGVS